MNNLKANVINELQKLFLKKKIIILLLIAVISCFVSALFLSNIQAKFSIIALSSVSFPLMILTIFVNIFLPLFIFMSASELFSGEVGNNSLKLVLLKPINRLKIFASKNIAIAIYIFINLSVVFITSIFSSIFLTHDLILANLPKIIFAYFIDIIPAIILAIFASFIVQFFKSNSAALISCILCFITIKILSLFIKGLNNIIFTSYLNWYSIWSTGSSHSLTNINILLMILSYGLIFFTIGYYIFDKKEV